MGGSVAIQIVSANQFISINTIHLMQVPCSAQKVKTIVRYHVYNYSIIMYSQYSLMLQLTILLPYS